jgi:dienelactone hydrolase
MLARCLSFPVLHNGANLAYRCTLIITAKYDIINNGDSCGCLPGGHRALYSWLKRQGTNSVEDGKDEYMSIATQAVSYRDGDTELSGIFAWDDANHAKRPGILVVHGGAGLDNHAKGRARRMAELGYIAFACDMYGEGVVGDRQRVIARIAELRKDPSILCQRANAAVEVLASHPLVDGRIAAIGYCFGGMTVLELARSGKELAGVVSVHGTLNTTRPARVGVVKPKFLVCHGALDPHVPMAQVNAFAEEMNAAGTDWQLNVYSGALHGFTHEPDGPELPGVGYNALADRRSSVAIREFLGEVFGGDADVS